MKHLKIPGNQALAMAVPQFAGELMSAIRNRGFSIVEPPELEPLVVDWDELQAERLGLFPGYERAKIAA